MYRLISLSCYRCLKKKSQLLRSPKANRFLRCRTNKLDVINAWKSHNNNFSGDPQIRQLFQNYWNDVSSIETDAIFEHYLTTKNDWFDEILKKILNDVKERGY